MSHDAEQLVFRGLAQLHESRDEHFGNGRTVRNAFEFAIRRMAIRIAPISPVTHELLTKIEVDDISFPGIKDDDLRNLASTEYTARFKCPHCGKRITGTDSLVLKEVNCPHCQGKLALSRLSDVEWSKRNTKEC
jgi:DNA-directed RNA polymerase subunit RPC12/RpoP